MDSMIKGFDRNISTSLESQISNDLLLRFYFSMLRIRKVEELIAKMIEEGLIICPCHLYIGQEAVAVGVCTALNRNDYVYSTHRSHGHYLAKGGSLRELIAELLGRRTGCSGGHGGSMHLVSPDMGFIGSSAIVGGSIPLAVGSALAFSLQNSEQVSVVFFGDGAATEGVLYECLNIAALMKLPVIFVCENNFYSTHMHISLIQASSLLYKKAEAFGVYSLRIDGNDVVEVYKATVEAVQRAKLGEGPTFLECITYRWRGHVGPNWDLDKGIRDPEEVEHWVRKCPINKLEIILSEKGLLTDQKKEEICLMIDRELKDAMTYARRSPYPDSSSSLRDLYI